MNKVNYDKKMQEVISGLNEKKSLLLHVCCAPCLSGSIERLTDHFDLTLYFYNPNISSKEEFEKRALELERFIKETGIKAHIIIEPYEHSEFLKISNGLEDEPEKGRRCHFCYRQRLFKTAQKCKEDNYDYFATTLTLSPLKDSQVLNKIGEEIGEREKVNYLYTDFKKRNGFKRSVELSEKYGLYRQNFCGCEFSKIKGD